MKTRDIDIRSSLHTKLQAEHCYDIANTLILNELSLCQGDARIDVAVINGAMSGYEIKSESDTLERLPSQSETYNKVFDTMTILTASKYIESIIKVVPEWWGVTKAEMQEDEQVHFSPIRVSMQNPSIDSLAIAQLLWREEAIGILKEKGLQKGLLSKPRKFLWEALATNLTLNDLKFEVRRALKARKDWRVH